MGPLCLLLLTLSACEEQNVLLLSVTADSWVSSYDLVILERGAKGPVLEARGEPVDAEDPSRDISRPGQALRLALTFHHPGTYRIHLVGRSTKPPQVASRWFVIDGLVRGSVHLVSVAGLDHDGDGFLTTEDCTRLASPEIECDLTDCDDENAAVNPGAVEICGNEVDEDCDGLAEECPDRDGDGWPDNLDCDDNDPLRNPGEVEAPNSCPTAEHPDGVEDPKCGDGIDQDCDGQDTACVTDNDCDGYSPPEDCDDDQPRVHPGASEICGNNVDENCNGEADEGCVNCDLDGDGYQREDASHGCPTLDYPDDRPFDCNDFDAGINPGTTEACGGMEGGAPACAAMALCDGVDNDCDGEVDEGCPSSECDGDGDGFMNSGPGCDPPPGLEDCDDASPMVYPGAPDVCGDGILQNCNTDTPCTEDNDGDGYNASVDCDDTDPEVHPHAVEVCNGVDDDCDGLIDEGNPDASGAPLVDVYCNDDGDGVCGDPDGFGRCVCTRIVPATQRDPSSRVACPDEDLAAEASPRCVFAPQPGFEECDFEDHDCNGVPDDRWGVNLLERGQPCGPDEGACVAGHVVGCNLEHYTEGAFNVHFVCSSDFVGAQFEELCNGLDDDCDGDLPEDEVDSDQDGYLECTGCAGLDLAPGLVGCNDCFPDDNTRHPGAPELCNGIDDNCTDGLDDDGEDQCGGGTPDCCGEAGCVNLQTSMSHCGSCDRPCPASLADHCEAGSCRCGEGERCTPGARCVDIDGTMECECTPDTCTAGCCDGGKCISTADQDDDRCGLAGTCHACQNGRVCDQGVCLCFGEEDPPDEETCGDGVDNDCNGDTDCEDSHCEGEPCGAGKTCEGGQCVCHSTESHESICDDGLDNDCNGDTDCEDSRCDGETCGPDRVCDNGQCVQS